MAEKTRIAVIGDNTFDCLEWHLCYTLRKMGHEARIFGEKDTSLRRFMGANAFEIMRRASGLYERTAYAQLANNVITYKPGLIIVCYRHLAPNTIGRLKDKIPAARIVHINSDHIVTMSYQRQYLLNSAYDAWFTKDHYQVKFMRDILGLNVHYLAEAYNPDIHRPPDNPVDEKKRCDLLVIASLYPYRNMILERLSRDLSIDMEIHGPVPRWMATRLPMVRPPLYGKEKAAKFFSAKICLNTFHYAEIESVNCRFFEIVGSGGFQICDDKPAIYEFLEKDREIVTYANYSELREKIAYYLDHESEREQIRARAFDRFKSKHTYEQRLNEMFRILAL